MRQLALAALGLLAACTSGDLEIPDPQVLTEVSPYSAAAYGDPYTYGTSGTGLVNAPVTGPMPGADLPPQPTTPLDDDVLNLTLYTIEQQKFDARAAERELAEARNQLVVVSPEALPETVAPEVNLTLFAQGTGNAVGERVYRRGLISNRIQGRSTCRRFRDADEAQRAFLSRGGPERDPYGLDPDGDGFACAWDPTPYRRLRL